MIDGTIERASLQPKMRVIAARPTARPFVRSPGRPAKNKAMTFYRKPFEYKPPRESFGMTEVLLTNHQGKLKLHQGKLGVLTAKNREKSMGRLREWSTGRSSERVINQGIQCSSDDTIDRPADRLGRPNASSTELWSTSNTMGSILFGFQRFPGFLSQLGRQAEFRQTVDDGSTQFCLLVSRKQS